MKKSKYALLSIMLVISVIAVLANFFKLDFTQGAVAVENSDFSASSGSCTPGDTPYIYTITGSVNVRNGAGSSATIVGSLTSGQTVTVYCTTGSWARISSTEEKYVSTSYMSKKNPSYTVSSLTKNPSTFYRNKSFSGSLSITNIENIPGSATDITKRFSVSVENSGGGDASSYISLNKGNYSDSSIGISFSKNGTVPVDTYRIIVKFDGSEIARRTFEVLKDEFYFDLNENGPESVAENETGIWTYSVSNLTPSSLSIDDFDISITKNGSDYTSRFDIEYKNGSIEVVNKERLIGYIGGIWSDYDGVYTPQGTYTVSITLKNKNDYADDRVSNYTKTAKITITKKKGKVTEITTDRETARYAIEYQHLDYDVDIVSASSMSGIKTYTVNENASDGTYTQVTYTESQMKETYPNINLSQIYTDSRNSNKVAVDYGDSVYIVNYLDHTITFYETTNTTPQALLDTDFETLYPTAYEKLKSNLYKTDAAGNILYHQTGIGTKNVKKISVLPNQLPQAITGGEVKLKLRFSGYLTSELNNFQANLVKESNNQKLIDNAGASIYDSNFEMLVDTSEINDALIYLTIKYISNRDEYIGNYKVNYGYGALTNSSTFELLDGKTDYTIYSELDPGNNTNDPLVGTSPNANKKYDYNIGFYMKKSKIDYDNVELESIGYNIFTKRVELDESGNYVFFDEIEYITKIKRIASGKVYFDSSTDNGVTYEINKEMSINDFKDAYDEAWEYFKDYAENKTTLKYYNLDANGNVISDNFEMHPIKMYAATETAINMSLDYQDSENVLKTVLMDDTFKRAYPTMYRLISTKFSYTASGDYILGAIRGRRKIKTNTDGSTVVGQDVTDQFYVRVNKGTKTDAASSVASKALTILPKTEVNPGVYYIYVTHGGMKAIGYLYTDDTPDAAIDIEIYPELWNRNIHMTSFKYGTASYDVLIDDPIPSNSVSDATIAYANVESYLDFNLTLNYIYNLDNLSYKVQYREYNDEWIDVPDYFNINAQIHASSEITDLTYETKGLTASALRLTTKSGKTKKGDYRLVFDYSNNGVVMPTVTKYFTIGSNYYGISVNQDEIEKDSFYSNYGDTLSIPIHASSVDYPDNLEFVLEYVNEGAEEVWDKSKQQFKNYKNGNVIFNYTYTVESVSDDESIILLAISNQESSSKPLAEVGKYTLNISYQENDGEIAETSFNFRVDEPKRDFVVTKDKATAREDEMFITRSLRSEYIIGSRLVGDEISYKIEMYVPGEGYVDVSSIDADLRLFEISTKWEDTDINDKINYNGEMKINLDVDKIDRIFDESDNRRFQLVITLAHVRYEVEMPNLRELFKWQIEDVSITGTIEDNGNTIEVEGYYNNASPKLAIKLDTIYERNAKFLITNVCTSLEKCTPSEDMINFNDRFDVISQKPDEIIVKAKDDLTDNQKLDKGKYQVVVYYSQTDFDIFDFIVRNDYLKIELGEISIQTKIRDIYSEELFTNKDSTITVPVNVIGASYDQVSIKITNDDQSISYNQMFSIDNDKFNNEHILEIKYDSNQGIEPNQYLLMVSKDNDGEIIEDHHLFEFNSTYYNYSITDVSYNPDPAVPNYVDGGEIIFNITTDELMTADTLVDNEYRNQFVQNLRVFNSDNTDVTEDFNISYKVGSSIADFQVILRYSEENNLTPGEYKVVFNVTKDLYSIEKNVSFEMGELERRIKITDVVIDSLSRDNLIHKNVGGTYIINYTTNKEINTADLYVRVSDQEGNDLTDKFIINKDDLYHVYVKFDSSLHTINYGTYRVTLTYADPITHNNDVKETDVIMYGDYKEISIKDISASTRPILAENEDQYYNFTLDIDNLTDEDIMNMKVRIYDEEDNIVYSDIPSDNVLNIFEVIKITDNTYKVNILPYKARVGAYYISLILPEAYGLNNISNRLTLTIDDTLYKVNLLNSSSVVTSDILNGNSDIYDFIGVDGTFNFETTSPDIDEYSIKIFNNLALIKEIPVDASSVSYYKQILFNADEISNGEVEFALCIRGLPYASIKKDVLEYIKITELAVILDNRDISDEVTLDPGDEAEFELYIRPENATNKNLIFTSSDSNVATFLGNKIVVHDNGSSLITVKNKEISKTFTLNVSSKIESSVYEIDQDKKTIFVNSLKQKSLSKDEFISNLVYLNDSYIIYNGDNQDVTNTTDVVGTNFKIKSGNLSYTVIVIGDLNGSGTIDMGDITSIYRAYRGSITYDEIRKKAAKVTKNDNIVLGDVTSLYRFYRGVKNEI